MLLLQLRVLRIQKTNKCLDEIKQINLNLIDDEINNDNKDLLKTSSLEINSFKQQSLNNNKKLNENFLLIENDDVLFSYESGSFDDSVEWFSLLIEHLVILSLLQILSIKNDNKIEFNNAFGIKFDILNRLTLEKMAQKGFGFYREQVKKKILFFLNNINVFFF